MSDLNLDIISWNVRGLNSAARCLAVHETLADNPYQIACLQETKLHSIDLGLASFLGAHRLNNYTFKPAAGTRGHPYSLERRGRRPSQCLHWYVLLNGRCHLAP
jgi:hypothetical protein